MKSFAKRMLALAGAAAIFAGSLTTAQAAPTELPYEGVADWAVLEVTAMEELGLIPDSLEYTDLTEEITRLDMARIAVSTYEKVTGEEVKLPWFPPFEDTDDPDVAKAYEIGIVQGDGNGLFRPDDSLTRLEFFCFVGRYLEASGMELTEDCYSNLAGYTDAASLPEWALDPTRLTVGLEIVQGSGTTLDWDRTATAAEALVLFYRAHNASIGYDPADEFTDLSPWAETSVLRMDQLELIPEGVKAASMTGTISRADLCRMVMRTYKLLTGLTDEDLGTPEDVFEDTDDLDILNAYTLGIINGRGNGIFDPDSPISRQDFFTISANFLRAVDYWYIDDIYVDLTDYPDGGDLASYAKRAAQVMIGVGAVQGDELGRLNPTAEIVSQEAVTVFFRIYDFYTKWEADPVEPTPYEGVTVCAFAKQYVGYPYVSGGRSPSTGFDCSGFVYYVYKQFGYELLPGAKNQWNSLDTRISLEDLLPGDVVFFSRNGSYSGIFHVGIYIGDGQFIHAANSDKDLIITDMDNAWYANRYLGAKRVL